MIDYERLERCAPDLREEFVSAKPFSHVVIDDFLPEGVADAVDADFDAARDWTHYRHYNERKLAITDLRAVREETRNLVRELHSDRFLALLEDVTGIAGLGGDPDLEGGCLHKVLPGGSLNVHTDFLSHSARPTWTRQLNLLLYFNRRWEDAWQGDLELWHEDLSSCARSISPRFNRCVIFRTGEASYHGHPRALACPPDFTRRSLALYYFRDEGVRQGLRPTRYRALPGDPRARRLLVAADTQLLKVYAFLKRTTPLTDRMAGRLLRLF